MPLKSIDCPKGFTEEVMVDTALRIRRLNKKQALVDAMIASEFCVWGEGGRETLESSEVIDLVKEATIPFRNSLLIYGDEQTYSDFGRALLGIADDELYCKWKAERNIDEVKGD